VTTCGPDGKDCASDQTAVIAMLAKTFSIPASSTLDRNLP
jgi:hypothetical protein